jgi:ABC-type sugar transport system ATPase subunit
MSGIQLQQLCKTFPGDVKAVHNLDLEVKEGELLVLMGPSGCGKSTTLRMIAGLEKVTSGSVHANNKDITSLHPGKRNIGMVFQNYALYPHKTIYKNLAFGLKLRKTPKAEIQKLISDISERLNISSLLERYPDQLSGGQKQRVALGRALLRQADFLLFDEPLSNLDAALRQQLRIEIAQLHRERKFTGIFVTHDQTEAMTLGDRIAVMNEGQIVQLATPEEIYHKPADIFVASFTGSPAMNIFSGKLEQNNFVNDLFSIEIKSDKLVNLASIGIRPEDILAQKGEISFEAKVIQPELNGMDWIIHASNSNVRFSYRSDVSMQPGETVTFSVTPEKIHYFDESGKRINP